MYHLVFQMLLMKVKLKGDIWGNYVLSKHNEYISKAELKISCLKQTCQKGQRLHIN